MNWEHVEANWKQLKGQLKAKWGKLTDDDMKVLSGKKDQLVSKLQERYGILKDDAERQIDAWISTVKPSERRDEEPREKTHPRH